MLKLLYMAHPVEATEGHTVAQNAESAAAFYRAIKEALLGTPWVVTAPWLADLWAHGLEVDPHERGSVMRACAEWVVRCDALVLCGPYLSRGMTEEMLAAYHLDKIVLSCHGDPPERVAMEVQQFAGAHLHGPACQETIP